MKNEAIIVAPLYLPFSRNDGRRMGFSSMQQQNGLVSSTILRSAGETRVRVTLQTEGFLKSKSAISTATATQMGIEVEKVNGKKFATNTIERLIYSFGQ